MIAFGIAIAGSVAFACQSEPEEKDPVGGVDDAGVIKLADNACHDLQPVHAQPVCDGCERALCCEEVLECEKSSDCKAARACFGACRREDLDCATACLSAHPQGAQLQANIDRCAGNRCPNACQTASIGEDVPDAGHD